MIPSLVILLHCKLSLQNNECDFCAVIVPGLIQKLVTGIVLGSKTLTDVLEKRFLERQEASFQNQM